MLFNIIAFVERGLTTHMDWLNIEGFDLEPYLIRFWTHDVWICSWQQFECYQYNKLEGTTKYVPIRDLRRNSEFCYDRMIVPRDYSSVRLAISRMWIELVHKICISTVSFMCLGDFFNTLFFWLQGFIPSKIIPNEIFWMVH
jgi:hypothetical protein